MEDRFSKETVERFVAKLRDLRKYAIMLNPLPHYDDFYEPEDKDTTQMQIINLYEKAIIIFDRFGINNGIKSIESMLNGNRDNLLTTVSSFPDGELEYVMVQRLVRIVDNYIFAYSNKEEDLKQASLSYSRLYEILSNSEKTFTITNRYPSNEDDLQTIIEGILICSFPKLIRKPAITTAIKNFIPDTGIPEAKTLIEYKFITRKNQVQIMVDEILADSNGYKHPDWEKIIFVFYETERFLPEDKWKEQLKSFKQADVVVIKGTTQLKRVT